MFYTNELFWNLSEGRRSPNYLPLSIVDAVWHTIPWFLGRRGITFRAFGCVEKVWV